MKDKLKHFKIKNTGDKKNQKQSKTKRPPPRKSRKSDDKKEGKKQLKRDEKIEYRLAEGALIEKDGDSYVILKKLGKGAFAAVYEATRKSDRVSVAVKVEFFDRNKEHRIPQEAQVYKLIETLRKKDEKYKHIIHFLRYYDHLNNPLAEFLILQRAGESIDSICLKHSPVFNTAVQWAIQALESLQNLHMLGYIHRDIKAANFIISDCRRILFVIDFGMAVKFVNDPKKMPKTSVYEFIGTAKYASRTAHNGMPQARRDDVESWLYLSMEFFQLDILPWRSSKNQKIVQKKNQFMEGSAFCDLFRILPRGYQAIVGMIRETVVMDDPHYEFIYDVLKWIATTNKVDLDASFAWKYVGKKGSKRRIAAANELLFATDKYHKAFGMPKIDVQRERKMIKSVLRHTKDENLMFPKASFTQINPEKQTTTSSPS